MNSAAQDYYINSRRHIPRVHSQRGRWRAATAPPRRLQPSLGRPDRQGSQLGGWAPYDAVAAALRSLAQCSLVETTAREAARATLRELFQHPTPFDANVRFPEGELYLCVDRGKLLRVEAAADHYSWRIIQACEAFMEAVSVAAANGTLKWQDDFGAPVVYDRAIFEEAFHLTWTDDAA